MEKDKTYYRFAPVFRVLLLTALFLSLVAPGSAQAASSQNESGPNPVESVTETSALEVVAGPQAVNAAPVIIVWYGSAQSFGLLGNPQRAINILGNVSDADGQPITLTYSLNDGDQAPLSLGPDDMRLAKKGDFNIEIPIASLKEGSNKVTIYANDNTVTVTTDVSVQYTKGQVWPSVYKVNWSQVSSIQSVAQIVDGKWVLGSGGVLPEITGYDRVLAMGDVSWQNYIVTVPVTILPPNGGGTYTDGGVGIILRWQGHEAYRNPPEQPLSDWTSIGAYGYYRYRPEGPHYAMRLAGESPVTKAVTLDYNSPYYFKMKVEGVPGKYSLKVWPVGSPEPTLWDIERQDTSSDLQTGSFLLVAHLVRAVFGNVLACPTTQTYPLNIATTGRGTVSIEPQKSSYQCGDVVKVTAKPGTGASFINWTGDASGSDLTTLVMIDGTKSITANFSNPAGDLNQKVYLPSIINR